MKRSLLLGAFVSSLVACDASAPPSTDSEPTAERADKGPARGKPGDRPSLAERVVEKTVVWPARSAIDVSTRSRFAATELERVDSSGVPVLAPSRGLEASADASGATEVTKATDATRFARSTVVAKPDWFTISLADSAFVAQEGAARDPSGKGAGITVFVQGKRLAKRVADVPPALGRHTVRGRPAWITQNEHVWSATWEENGATYGLELECGSFDDPRCRGDAYLREVAESLVFVGGRGVSVDGGAK